MTSIYQSGWKPSGVRKDWEKCSIRTVDASRLLGDWGDGRVTDACGWFSADNTLRVLVADTDAGKRITLRRNARGSTMVFQRRPK